jgi:hypothetical protein
VRSASAFSEIGFDAPFGQPPFQAIWVTHFTAAKENGAWLTEAMEATIQECQRYKIGVPPQFFDAKHGIEKSERAEFDRRHRRAPL